MAYFISILFAIAMLFPALAQEAKKPKPTITIAADEWCPINCDPKSDKPGIGIELAKKTFEPLGYQINYVIMPWKEALEQVRLGKVDAVVGASRADDVRLVFPSISITKISDDFFVRSGNSWRYQGIVSLAKKRIGVIEDYGYSQLITKFISDNKNMTGIIFQASGEEALKENINKLLNDRIDVLVESRLVMDYTLQKLQMEDKIEWAGGITQEPVYLAFSPALAVSKQRAAQFDSVVSALKNAGSLEPLYKTYGLRP